VRLAAALLLLPLLLQAAPRPIEELNAFAKAQLAPDGDLQASLTEELKTKLITDLGLPADEAKKLQAPLADWMYSVEFPDEAGCNPWTNDLLGRDKTYKERLEAQAVSAAAFLSDFHFRMLGSNISLFKLRKIKVCVGSHDVSAPSIAYDRARFQLTLYIGPKQAPNVPVLPIRRNNLHPYTLDDLKEAWKNGDHFGKKYVVGDFFDARKNPVRVYWNFLNPIGEVRTALRDGIRVAALKSASALRALKDSEGAVGLKAKMLALLGDDAAVGAADAAKILNVTEAWVAKLEKPEAAEEMAFAALSSGLEHAIESSKTSVKRKQWGFVNVENFHKIDVSFSTGDVPQYRETVQVPDNLDIDVTQVGFVNVSTTDRVEVDVALKSFVSAKHFEKATLLTLLHPKS